MLGLSLHGWENVMVVFLILAGLTALAAAASTWAVVHLQRIELAKSDNEFAKYKLETAKDISEANARAAEARLELEKFKAPRSLSSEQRKRIADKLKSFGGVQFDGAWTNLDPEIDLLFTAIEETLVSAGWKGVSYNGGGQLYGRKGYISVGQANAYGVIVNIDKSKSPNLLWPALDLVKALTEEGIGVGFQDGAGFVSANSDTIHILIGPKH